ncbi:MAG: enoyl-CoA hydratase-related protein, partial [Paracoccaceae bacterium]
MVTRDAQEWEFLVKRYLVPVRMIAAADKPVIAALNGDTVGGGLGLAIASDMRVAVDTARFCAPFIAIGLAGCDMSCGYFLPRLVGMGAASDMMMTARFVKADEARRIGLVNRVVAADRLAETVAGLAAQLAARSPVAMGWTKRAIRRSMDLTMDAEFDYEVLAQVQCLQTDEHKTALAQYQSMMMGKGRKSGQSGMYQARFLDFTEEQQAFAEQMARFADREIRPNLRKWEAAQACPTEVFAKLAEIDALATGFAQSHGGAGGMVEYLLMIEALAASGAGGVTLSVYVHTALACAALELLADEVQTERYLKPALNGQKLGCWAYA